jgi:hypothetical protein
MALLLVGSITVALCSMGQEPAARLSLSCDQPVFDFGEKTPDQVVSHTFVLQNGGTQPVHIANVRTSCGCTTAALKTNTIDPGQSADLAVILTLQGRKGPQRKTIYVESSDPTVGNLRLEVAGQVTTPIAVQPEGLHFGSLARDGDVARDVLLVARTNVTFHVKVVRPSSSGFAAEATTQEEGKAYRITIRSLGPRIGGTSHTLVQVETDLAAMPVVSIPVTAFTVSDIVAAPATLMLVQGATNESRTYSVNLSSPAGKPFKVVKVEPPRPDVACTVVPTTPDRYRIDVRVTGWLGDLNGTSLRIETDLESMKDVKVPLRVIPGPGAPEAAASK